MALLIAIIPLSVFALFVRLWIYLLAHLLWRDSQRAEYLADYLAAKVGGTDAALSGLQKLHMEEMVYLTVERFYSSYRRGDLFDELRRLVYSIPARELERVMRVQKLTNSRLDATHPPTAYRVQLLQAREIRQPAVTIDETTAAHIEVELATVKSSIQASLLDRQMEYHEWRAWLERGED